MGPFQIVTKIRGDTVFESKGLKNNGDNLSPVSLTPVVNSLSPVSNISASFRKNSKWPQWDNQGPGGNLFMKKPCRQKSRVRLPLRNDYL